MNLESAQELNRLLHEFLPEQAIFRIDHFLAWQPYPMIMGMRFTNGIFEPLWDRNYIERVEIVWEETLALEGRASYFDHAGAFKDLIQNHLLQLLCFTAMEAPTALHRRNLRDRKLELVAEGCIGSQILPRQPVFVFSIGHSFLAPSLTSRRGVRLSCTDEFPVVENVPVGIRSLEQEP